MRTIKVKDLRPGQWFNWPDRVEMVLMYLDQNSPLIFNHRLPYQRFYVHLVTGMVEWTDEDQEVTVS